MVMKLHETESKCFDHENSSDARRVGSDTSLFATLRRSSKTLALCFSRRSGQTAGIQSFRGSSGTTFTLWASMALVSAQGLPDLVLMRKLLELAQLAFAEAPQLHISRCTLQSLFHFHYLLSLLLLHSWLICLGFGRTNFGLFGLFDLFLLQMRWACSLRWARFACQGLVCCLEWPPKLLGLYLGRRSLLNVKLNR